jgi:hypothetical protein
MSSDISISKEEMTQLIIGAHRAFDKKRERVLNELKGGEMEPIIDYEGNRAERHNEGKHKWSLIDFQALEPLVEVLMFGEKKYSRDNWKNGMDTNEILDSMLRHIAERCSGKMHDDESGLPISGHILANAMFLAYYDLRAKEWQQ